MAKELQRFGYFQKSSLTTKTLSYLRPYHIINRYGPFSVMTKKRIEISFEGSQDGVTWKAYGFKWKPQHGFTSPKWVQPHHPRLDWQMWFVPFGKPYQSPWVIHTMKRLLEGSQSVLDLFKYNPFPGKPPTYIRAVAHQYDFTEPETKKITGDWWSMTPIGVYVEPISLRR